MREIKFRAWNDIDKKMVLDIQKLPLMKDIFKSKHYIKQQYTGLKDKNGVGIYEGDIVEEKRSLAFGDSVYKNLEVKYIAPSFKAGDFPMANYAGITWKVIGNIHQNPKLLEK